ncbi:MAG: LL-diaminopimelate aminotransferase [Candidatus Desulfofervidus sp.]|nr:LL-diaminopimelate aminotransferase [Candidatus Desulfofervidus sp.]
MQFSYSNRLKQLPPYLFAEIDRLKAEATAKGIDVIDLGVGDPDIPTPSHIVEILKKTAEKPENHRYPSYAGMLSFRKAVADWYERRFDVKLDPQKEILALIGSKEGIAHLPLAFINPGDIALVPSPAYPVYHIGVLFAGGKSYFMPLIEKNDFLPDLDKIPSNIASQAKIMFLNYPNNPTAAVAEEEFFKRVIFFAKKYEIMVCHDAAYTELYYDGYKPLSFLSLKEAKECGIEVHSLSKTFNMTGWRIGFAVGHPEVIAGLGKVKSNIDSGVFQAIQEAGIAALNSNEKIIEKNRQIFKKRRDIMANGLKELGFELTIPKATFYLWVKVPKNYTSMEFCQLLLKKIGIVVTPGIGFGEPGEGFFRMSLTISEEKIYEALARLEKLTI